MGFDEDTLAAPRPDEVAALDQTPSALTPLARILAGPR